MKLRKRRLTLGALGILLLVALFAALAPLSLRTDNATYAQTETTAPLPAPTLTAEAKGANAVELNWTAVDGAARYNLALYTEADGHQRLEDVVAPATTYTHPDLITGRTYYYWVRGVSAAGEDGEWSERKHATASDEQSTTATPTATPASTATATPTTTATPASNATATPTATPTTTPTTTLTPTPTPTATASTQTTATPTLTPAVTGKLPAPALTADAKGANAVELNWTAVAGAARYHLALYTEADGHQRLEDVDAPATTFTHPDLTAGRTYYYWVRAVRASGEEGEWSERKHATASDEQSSTATPTSDPSLERNRDADGYSDARLHTHGHTTCCICAEGRAGGALPGNRWSQLVALRQLAVHRAARYLVRRQHRRKRARDRTIPHR